MTIVNNQFLNETHKNIGVGPCTVANIIESADKTKPFVNTPVEKQELTQITENLTPKDQIGTAGSAYHTLKQLTNHS